MLQSRVPDIIWIAIAGVTILGWMFVSITQAKNLIQQIREHLAKDPNEVIDSDKETDDDGEDRSGGC